MKANVLISILAVAILAFAGAAKAQDKYPSRSIQMVAPLPPGARLTAIFRSATARQPSIRELQTLLLTLENLRAQFSQDAAGATKLLHIGDSVPAPGLDASEHAAWTSLCRSCATLAARDW